MSPFNGAFEGSGNGKRRDLVQPVTLIGDLYLEPVLPPLGDIQISQIDFYIRPFIIAGEERFCEAIRIKILRNGGLVVEAVQMKAQYIARDTLYSERDRGISA